MNLDVEKEHKNQTEEEIIECGNVENTDEEMEILENSSIEDNMTMPGALNLEVTYHGKGLQNTCEGTVMNDRQKINTEDRYSSYASFSKIFFSSDINGAEVKHEVLAKESKESSSSQDSPSTHPVAVYRTECINEKEEYSEDKGQPSKQLEEMDKVNILQRADSWDNISLHNSFESHENAQ